MLGSIDTGFNGKNWSYVYNPTRPVPTVREVDPVINDGATPDGKAVGKATEVTLGGARITQAE